MIYFLRAISVIITNIKHIDNIPGILKHSMKGGDYKLTTNILVIA